MEDKGPEPQKSERLEKELEEALVENDRLRKLMTPQQRDFDKLKSENEYASFANDGLYRALQIAKSELAGLKAAVRKNRDDNHCQGGSSELKLWAMVAEDPNTKR